MSEIVPQNPLLRFSELYKESNTPPQKARTKPLSPSADRFTPDGTNSRNPLLLTVPTPLESQRPRNPLEGYNFNTSLKPETGKTNSPKSSTPTQPVSPLSPSTPKQPKKEGVKVDIDAATSATGTLSGSLTPVSTGAVADNGGDQIRQAIP